jgi:quercetin dioxygenase-like cupin family protein
MRNEFPLSLFAAAIASMGSIAAAQAADPAPSPATEAAVPVLKHALAGIEGKEVLMVTVTYPPGAGSPPHRHDANTFVYVLEGSVVMQVAGGQPVTLTAGQTFYESPTDIHAVSRNASSTQPAKILAILVKDAAKPATVPVK